MSQYSGRYTDKLASPTFFMVFIAFMAAIVSAVGLTADNPRLKMVIERLGKSA